GAGDQQADRGDHRADRGERNQQPVGDADQRDQREDHPDQRDDAPDQADQSHDVLLSIGPDGPCVTDATASPNVTGLAAARSGGRAGTPAAAGPLQPASCTPSISTASSRRQIAACSRIRGTRSPKRASSAAATSGRSSWSRTYTFSRVPAPNCAGSAGWRARAAASR